MSDGARQPPPVDEEIFRQLAEGSVKSLRGLDIDGSPLVALGAIRLYRTLIAAGHRAHACSGS